MRVARDHSRPQSRARATAATSAGCSRISAGRASRRYGPIRNRHRGAERGNAPSGHRPTRRSPVLQTRHYRLRLFARGLPAGSSSGVSTSIASASSKMAPTLVAPPISVEAISCRSTRWRPIRLRLSGDPPRCVTAQPQSAASSARPTIASRTPLPSCAAAPFQTYGLPAKAPLANVQSAPCVNVETRTAISSVNRGVDGSILLDTGGGNFAFHADAYGRKATDYSIPSYPYLFDPNRAHSTAGGQIRRSGRTGRRSAAPISYRAASSARR